MLGGVGVGRLTLGISRVGQRDDAVVTLDQILVNDLVLGGANVGAALVAVFLLDLKHFLFDDLANAAFVGQDGAQIGDQCLKTKQLVLDLGAFHARQSSQCHLDDGLRLRIRKTKALHQLFLGLGDGCRAFHDPDDFINVVVCDLVALKNVGTGQRLVQIELGAARDNRFLMRNIVVKDLGQREHLGLAVHNGQHIDRAGVLKLRIFIQLIENDLTVGVSAVLNDDLHAVTARLVSHVGDALDALVAVQIGNGLTQHALVDTVRNFGDGDAAVFLVHLSTGAHHDATLTRGVGLNDAILTVDGAARGEVGSLDVFHQLGNGALGVIHAVDGGVDDLAKIMRRDVGRHTDGDTHSAVDKQVREACRKNGRLVQTVIEVFGHLDNVFV